MRLALALVCLLAQFLPSFAAERERSLLAGGLRRSYTLITPDNVTVPLPLIVVYHGGGQTAEHARRYARFGLRAAKENFAVAYPQGLDRDWNDGRISTDMRRRASADADDVEFTAQLIVQLESEGIVDPARVFLTGASHGGMMALRAACDLGGRIAGMAPVAANLPADWQCRATRMPALFIHGAEDDYMPIAGGRVAAGKTYRDLGTVLSVDETLTVFKSMNGCSAVKEAKPGDMDARAKTKAVVTEFECSNAPLKHIVIEGGGHAWPGAREGIAGDGLSGKISRDIDATAEIWAFFKSLPAP